MVSVVLNGEQFDYPQAWEELGKNARVGEVLKIACIGEKNIDRFGWEALLMNLLGCSAEFWGNLVIGIDQWVQLKGISRWVFKEKLLFAPFESFEVGGQEFYVCQKVGEMTAMHMAAGLAYFTQMGNGDEEAVDWLLAVFCELTTPAPPLKGGVLEGNIV